MNIIDIIGEKSHIFFTITVPTYQYTSLVNDRSGVGARCFVFGWF